MSAQQGSLRGGNAQSSLRRRVRQRGVTMIEFALVFLVFIVLLVGLMEIGRAVWTYTTIAHATRRGARYATMHGSNNPVLDGSDRRRDSQSRQGQHHWVGHDQNRGFRARVDARPLARKHRRADRNLPLRVGNGWPYRVTAITPAEQHDAHAGRELNRASLQPYLFQCASFHRDRHRIARDAADVNRQRNIGSGCRAPRHGEDNFVDCRRAD